MVNLIRFYLDKYLEIMSRKPNMDDCDGYLGECLDDWKDIEYCINVWSIASCL